MAGWDLTDVERGDPLHTLTYTNSLTNESFIFHISHEDVQSEALTAIAKTKGTIPDEEYVKKLYREKGRIYSKIGKTAMANLSKLRSVGPDTNVPN